MARAVDAAALLRNIQFIPENWTESLEHLIPEPDGFNMCLVSSGSHLYPGVVLRVLEAVALRTANASSADCVMRVARQILLVNALTSGSGEPGLAQQTNASVPDTVSHSWNNSTSLPPLPSFFHTTLSPSQLCNRATLASPTLNITHKADFRSLKLQTHKHAHAHAIAHL